MILRRSWMSQKSDQLRRLNVAEELLRRVAKVGGSPEPNYEFEPHGKKHKLRYFCMLRFQVPAFVRQNAEFNKFHAKVFGTGKDKHRIASRSLAALEVVERIEEGLDLANGTLDERLEEFVKLQKRKGSGGSPADEVTRFITWVDEPQDTTALKDAGSHRGLLEFSPEVIKNRKALAAAKALTLTARERLPEVHIHTEEEAEVEGETMRQWAEIRSFGTVEGVVGPKDEKSIGLDRRGAVMLALEKAYDTLEKDDLPVQSYEDAGSSFGMAKLFAKLPEDQFKDLNELLEQVKPLPDPLVNDQTPEENIQAENNEQEKQNQEDGSDLPKRLASLPEAADQNKSEKSIPMDDYEQNSPKIQEDNNDLQKRLASFRAHQEKFPLPIDSAEEVVLRGAPVTILRAEPGSGKTTRYPSMVSLLSSSDTSTRVVVAQPHRLTCQIAARRAAFEQDAELGSKDCPIGYVTTFESSLAGSDSRTIVYKTPGVLLQQAMNDPMFSDTTVLCIDEAFERDGETDLVLALAKQAVRNRTNHTTLQPLCVVLMTDSTDTNDWNSYFADLVGDDGDKLAIIDLPRAERAPVDYIHLGESKFPNHIVAIKRLRKKRGSDTDSVGDYDDALCEAAAKLIVEILKEGEVNEGTILCFLASTDEVLNTHKRLRSKIKKQQIKGTIDDDIPKIVHLHSSVDAEYQPDLFKPGRKIILATGLAGTSISIPDIKVVLDTGRTLQSPPIESTVSTTAFVRELAKVNMTKACGKIRGRAAGRESAGAGTCFRLFRKDTYNKFGLSTTPELLRFDLSQLVLHLLSKYDGRLPLSLLLDVPDPPTTERLKTTLRELAYEGHINFDPAHEDSICLTPLGQITSSIPAKPRVAKLLLMGISLGAVDSALRISALLTIPSVFLPPAKQPKFQSMSMIKNHTSDIAKMLEAYRAFEEKHNKSKETDVLNIEFQRVNLVQQQLEQVLKSALATKGIKTKTSDWKKWNSNSDRVAALIGLICGTTPSVAVLVNGKGEDFATRNVAGTAKMDADSVNFERKRVHCYAYEDLLGCTTSDGSMDTFTDTEPPRLHVTTSLSPLELALFAEDSSSVLADGANKDSAYLLDNDDYLLLADQWIPVAVSDTEQREAFLKLRSFLTNEMLQRVAQNPRGALKDPVHDKIVSLVLSMIEQQRGLKY